MSQTVAEVQPRTFSFLSGDGDNVYGWDAADNDWVIPMIQKKLDEGYTFWIVRRSLNPRARPSKLRTAADARDLRSVIIKDPDARQLFEQGRIGIVARPVDGREDEFRLERRAESAEDVAANDSVAHRAHRGG
jgi:hypothetical protein